MNKSIISGRLTADPELRQTKGNPPIPVTSFTVATPRRFSKDKKDNADFIDVVAWRTDAEFVCKYFTKGKRIEVCGELRTRMRESKSGDTIKVTELHAEEISFGGDKAEGEKAKPMQNSPAPDFEPDFGVDDSSEWPDFNQ